MDDDVNQVLDKARSISKSRSLKDNEQAREAELVMLESGVRRVARVRTLSDEQERLKDEALGAIRDVRQRKGATAGIYGPVEAFCRSLSDS